MSIALPEKRRIAAISLQTPGLLRAGSRTVLNVCRRREGQVNICETSNDKRGQTVLEDAAIAKWILSKRIPIRYKF